ncbi:MAG: 3-hydroxyisobutyrate dehydrogenase [Alphaproteobacteria bacterium]|nr:3-hydroxyisobutyrate dehydrogenase [Alphaproteobacteria bacterium]
MTKVGFIGTGNMGLPMMRNVVAKGFAVTAYDTHGPALDAAVKAGAARGASPAQIARDCEIVITILPSAANVEACYLGPDGILEGAASKTLCIDMSTIDPGTAQRVADRLGEKQVRYIDAPVSGGTVKAADGTLAIMVGGPASDFESARPVLATMGTNLIHVGPAGAGAVAKLCNNLIAGVNMVAVSEAFRIGEAFGVDPQVLTQVIANSSGGTWVMQHAHPVPGIVPTAASSRDYAPGFMVDLMTKDLGLAVNAAREGRVAVSVAGAALQVFRMASAHGLGRKDSTSVYQFLKPAPKDAPV